MTDNTETELPDDKKPVAEEGEPVRKWTLRILVLCLVLFIGYLTADRLTPVTSQARIHSLVVPVAAEVSGIVVEVKPDQVGRILLEVVAVPQFDLSSTELRNLASF